MQRRKKPGVVSGAPSIPYTNDRELTKAEELQAQAALFGLVADLSPYPVKAQTTKTQQNSAAAAAAAAAAAEGASATPPAVAEPPIVQLSSALESANQQLRSLTPQQLKEIGSLANPPRAASRSIEMVDALLRGGSDTKAGAKSSFHAIRSRVIAKFVPAICTGSQPLPDEARCREVRAAYLLIGGCIESPPLSPAAVQQASDCHCNAHC